MSVNAGAAETLDPAGVTPVVHGVVLGLFFCSGFSALVYEVLWMKELGLLFGNAAYAAATTLAAFFTGLALGAYMCGRLAARSRRPLLFFAVLEAGIAASALLYFAIRPVFHASYTEIVALTGGAFPALVAVKFGLALALLLPPAFLIGGTYPALSQFLVRADAPLSKTGVSLYALNTLGAALGAYTAGFYLPLAVGFRHAVFLAMAVNLAVAIVAGVLALIRATPVRLRITTIRQPTFIAPADASLSRTAIYALATLTGFVVLGLEVLYTRLFAQVLQNSVYTFSLILVVFLFALAAGSGLIRLARRHKLDQIAVLVWLFIVTGALIGLSPGILAVLTNGMDYVGGSGDWTAYLVEVFTLAAVVILPPAILAGAVFPLLFGLVESSAKSAGRAIGELLACNTVGGVMGSLVAGFVLMEALGLWASLRLMALLYILVGFVMAERLIARRTTVRLVAAASIIVVALFSDQVRLRSAATGSPVARDAVLEVWEGSAATVAVTTRHGILKLKINNHYTAGDSAAADWEAMQAHLPMLLGEHRRSVFLLGLGTGITAGAALAHPVNRLVVAEIVPEIATAARKYFEPFVNGLFEDHRAVIVLEDGRNYLLGTGEKFDVIIGDLFVSWNAGAGSLFTREHFQTVRDRLNPGGVFMQWLPLYELTRTQFDIIASTMLATFPQVTLWRANFSSHRPVIGLAGHLDLRSIKAVNIERSVAQMTEVRAIEDGDVTRTLLQGENGVAALLIHYCGNLTEAKHFFGDSTVNSDDFPIIEYRAPIEQRAVRAGLEHWFRGERLLTFLTALRNEVPPERDPFLAGVDPADKVAVAAGHALYSARVFKRIGDLVSAEHAVNHAMALLRSVTNVRIRQEAPGSESTLRRKFDATTRRYRELKDEIDALRASSGKGAGDN